VTPSTSPAEVAGALEKLSGIRRQAMAGKGRPLDSYESYSGIIQTLRQLSRSIADGLPGRAKSLTAAALPDLARAVDQASATRGLLKAALSGQGTQRELVTEAGEARTREQAALADFKETADGKARESYNTTVNGADVNIAERYLTTVTAQKYLTPGTKEVNKERFDSSVSARLAHMRGVQSSFAAAEIKRLERLRDDDVTALQLRAGLVGGCLLIAIAVSVATARSLTRPLSVLKRGSKRLAGNPTDEEPITFRGRNDEFADVVRALNTLRAATAEMRRRSSYAEQEQDQLAVEKAQLTEDHQLLNDELAVLRVELETVREQLAAQLPGGVGAEADAGADTGAEDATSAADYTAFADLGTRTLTLVERQLGVIESLEEKEADPDRLETLFKLDHMATRMRRHSENLLLLAGTSRAGHGAPSAGLAPAPLLDVLRAAVSEIAQYERVELGAPQPRVYVNGAAADDMSHLVAELLDNAAAFSPTECGVRLSTQELDSGEVLVSVTDLGEGIPASQLAELNASLFAASLGEPEQQPHKASRPWGLGMHVVARLSARLGVRVELREREPGGGTIAEVTVPRTLLHESEGSEPGPVGSYSTLPSDGADGADEGKWPWYQGAFSPAANVSSGAEDEHAWADDQAPTRAAEPGTGKVPQPDVSESGASQRAPGPNAPQKPEQLGETQATERQKQPDAAAHSGRPAATDQQGSGIHPGLPRRVPGQTPRGAGSQGPKKAPAAPGRHRGSATAEELRRRLDGFHQGTREGLRDATAEAQSSAGAPPATPEAAEAPGSAATPDTDAAEKRAGAQADGGTAKEAGK
jgi:signal transduction histidine kinase